MAGKQLRLPHGGAQAVEPQQDGRIVRRGEKVRLALLALRVVAVLTQTVAVQPEEAEKARAVLAHLGLPEVETVQQQLEARKKALEDEKNAAALEKRDR